MKRSRPWSDVDVETLALRTARPSAAVFDLDHTLWTGNCEDFQAAHVVSRHEALDTGSGRKLKLFEDVHTIFALLEREGVSVAIASASPARTTAMRLLRGFGLRVAAAEVHPGSKDAHLKAIAAALGAPLDRMLFFDDLAHNIRAAHLVGVGAAVQVRDGGARLSDLRAACERLRERQRGESLMRGWLASGRSVGSGAGGGGGACAALTEERQAPGQVGKEGVAPEAEGNKAQPPPPLPTTCTCACTTLHVGDDSRGGAGGADEAPAAAGREGQVRSTEKVATVEGWTCAACTFCHDSVAEAAFLACSVCGTMRSQM
jgi:HAD superfamily phosphatase (TIGR01681 family)